MQTTSGDMLSIIETLLVLARDSDTSESPRETVQLNQLMPTIINQINSTHNADNHVAIELQDGAELEVSAPVQAVSIGDNGEGIAAAEIKRIQQPFQRSSSQADGYGLGLDIVRRLCERFGWELDIRSEVGKGTVVRVRF